MEMKDVGLSEEMKETLKNSLAFQIKPEFKYVPKAYMNKENSIPKALWPVFIIKGLDGRDYTEIADMLEFKPETIDGKTRNTPKKPGRMALLSCQRGILSWRNLRDTEGNIVPAPKINPDDGILYEESLCCLSPTLIYELSNAIAEQSRLTEEELLGLE